MNLQSRRKFIKLTAASSAAIALPSWFNFAQSEAKPNIIFILIDDMGWKDVGFMGSSFYETPNIDRIAKEGIHFTNAYTSAAVCSPTRASILTGEYAVKKGITDWIDHTDTISVDYKNKKLKKDFHSNPNNKLQTPTNAFWLDLDEITIAEILKQNGYTTAHVGKWHLGKSDWHPENQGFDINIGGSEIGEPPTYFDPYQKNKMDMPNLQDQESGKYLTDRESDEAVNFIRKNKDKNFFLNYWAYAVHTPLEAKEDDVKFFADKNDEDNPDDKWNPKEDGVGALFRSKQMIDRQKNPTYAAMIKSVDDGVGKILAVLKECGIDDNTMIVFYSDNGGHIVSTNNEPLRLGKGHPYEGGIKVPLAIRWPKKIKKGLQSATPISSVDFYPTICSVTDSKLPKNKTVDGIDLSPILTKSKKIKERDLFWHYPHYWWGNKVRPYSIIRSGDWKLIKHYEDESFELFNLKNDPSEKNNLAGSQKVKVEELHEKLNVWLVQNKAKMPKPNPDYKEKVG